MRNSIAFGIRLALFSRTLVLLPLLLKSPCVVGQAITNSPIVLQTASVSNQLGLVFVTTVRPKDYTEETLAAAYEQKLTAEEFSLVVNPLRITPEMAKWARDIAFGATNDLQKARMLFDVVVSHAATGPVQYRQPQTAGEVFKNWNSPGASFLCGEAGRIYVASARCVGLAAYVVNVQKDCFGNDLWHSCVAVFIGNKALLIDPGYQMFGVKHEKFSLLDDVQATGIYECGLPTLEHARVAAKLSPGFSIVHVTLVEKLGRVGRLAEARDELVTMTKCLPNHAMTIYAQAFVAWKEGDRKRAIQLSRKSIELAPMRSQPHYLLGFMLGEQGELKAARESIQNALDHALLEDFSESCRRMIAWIDEKESAKAPPPNVETNR